MEFKIREFLRKHPKLKLIPSFMMLISMLVPGLRTYAEDDKKDKKDGAAAPTMQSKPALGSASDRIHGSVILNHQSIPGITINIAKPEKEAEANITETTSPPTSPPPTSPPPTSPPPTSPPPTSPPPTSPPAP